MKLPSRTRCLVSHGFTIRGLQADLALSW